jgi:hypothetical protein
MKTARAPAAISALSAALLCLAAGCGDVPRLDVRLHYGDPALDAATRKLMFVVRAVPMSGDPCSPLWTDRSPGLPERAWLVDYPARNDLVAAPLDVGVYTIFVYAYANDLDDRTCQADSDCANSTVGNSCGDIGGAQRSCIPSGSAVSPIAGGCAGGSVGDSSTLLVIPVDKNPG